MKLLFCRSCNDIVKLRVSESRSCECGKSSGYYLPDGWHAEVKGPAEVIGIANNTIRAALQALTQDSAVCADGPSLDAWMMSHTAARVKWVA